MHTEVDRPLICLLRSPSDPDPYEAAFAEGGFRVRQIPLLQFETVNEEVLRRALKHPEGYGGLILTSPRAVQTLQRQREALAAAWREKPAFVVGPRTAEEVAELGLRPVGVESGSGGALAERINEHGTEKPLLFLCGNRRRNELPDRLSEAGVPYEELTVYRTLLLREVDVCHPEVPDWLVFFSPSGVEALSAQLLDLARKLRVAAIGPTTAGALQDRDAAPDAVAEEPSPEALVTAILQSEQA